MSCCEPNRCASGAKLMCLHPSILAFASIFMSAYLFWGRVGIRGRDRCRCTSQSAHIEGRPFWGQLHLRVHQDDTCS